MKKRASIFSLIIATLGLNWMIGCQDPPPGGSEEGTSGRTLPPGLERYDPLESEEDRQVVPRLSPNDGEIKAGSAGQQASALEPYDPGWNYLSPQEQIDTLNSQAYRVQILTTKVYGEASAARRVAEEIFDRPVFMEYEVPYFKLRVGSFADRDAAENYQTRAKAAGYANAWVVMVTIGVKELTPLYDSLPSAPGDSADVENGPQPNE
ncbi:MAG: SPOR domain-containing protein [candidate division Zixibacteria bacterium]|nr:SPOR domain-containing protein [candidate division Zixibacteria bacterium]MDH3938885.1 SPOR domain-containing protein [candidate division Zixibacteria bacterium]MDH4033861.1 SPOR domain-containing protein [candidate division Zixibacteria bacterium]